MNKLNLTFNEIEEFKLVLPEDSRYALFDNPVSGKSIHIYFKVSQIEFRFTITHAQDVSTPEELVNQVYAINGPLSIPEWRIPPYQFEDSKSVGWACSFGLMEGRGLRVLKIFFESEERPVCITFSSNPENYPLGIPVFDQIAKSFMIIKENDGLE